MGRVTGSWLSGPQIGPENGVDNEYRGQDLGLPESGPGSLATGWPRVAGLLVDWLIAGGLAMAFFGGFNSPHLGTAQMGVWFVMGIFAVTLFGFTPGQYLLGLQVVSVDNRLHVGLGRAVVRGLLITLLIPALFTDSDLRGLHDLATKTAVVKR